ncbi:hypothetical protein Desgi_1028 [Desulfoscipio gibsoniae DSM 7213]|uniref:Uncharacterized protein n=1 Tax=Desulfoscipio gibsoniae DSM 7213 TaxID=767817 RepID=R4KFX9_9FIRM|nr:hypothetical protein Desgi_1028 [Desulfoscipio gibsoniae DSM 7213]
MASIGIITCSNCTGELIVLTLEYKQEGCAQCR